MTRIPIYQMTIGYQEEDGGEIGLIFPDENEENNSHSVLFTLAIPKAITKLDALVNYLGERTIYFPFYLNDKYLELEANFSYSNLNFKIPEVPYDIEFKIESNLFKQRIQFYFMRTAKNILKPYKTKKKYNLIYSGKHVELIDSKCDLLLLKPIDLQFMNSLFINYKGVFVGMTPAINEIKNNVNNT